MTCHEPSRRRAHAARVPPKSRPAPNYELRMNKPDECPCQPTGHVEVRLNPLRFWRG